MRNTVFLFLLLCFTVTTYGQTAFNLYNPDADAGQELSEAVIKASEENKNIFITIGGNWCGWCKAFNDLVTGDEELSALLENNYEVVHVNYSKENKNPEVLASLDYPQRFGFPVFVILDSSGKRIHTQNSAYLEEGKGHSKAKVKEFLTQWSPSALDPAHYK